MVSAQFCLTKVQMAFYFALIVYALLKMRLVMFILFLNLAWTTQIDVLCAIVECLHKYQ